MVNLANRSQLTKIFSTKHKLSIHNVFNIAQSICQYIIQQLCTSSKIIKTCPAKILYLWYMLEAYIWDLMHPYIID